MALVLVVAVLATATILGYAMLASSTLQSEISSNLMQAAGAEYVAESGVNVGIYYLQYPAAAPASWTNTTGYTLYATNVPVNDGTQSNFDLSVKANPQPNVYTIEATGRPSTGSAFSHTATAVVTVNRVQIPGAGVFGGSIAIPSRTTFSSNGVAGALAIQANGIITQSGGTISGTQSPAPLSSNAYIVPDSSSVNFFGVGTSSGNYLWTDNVTLGTPQLITASTLTVSKLPAQLSSNPAGIFYHDGDLTVTGNVTINGTLIIRNGTLTVQGNLTLNPAAQFPALICEDNAIIKGADRVLTANGVVFFGMGFSWTGSNTGSSLIINGALLMPAGASIASSTRGTVSVIYSAANTNVPLLTTFNQAALSVKSNSWSQ
jgi:hypothetical protein